MDQELESRIRLLAYELWVAADRPPGSQLKNWKEAEMLIAAMDQQKPAGPATDVLEAMDRAIRENRGRR